MNHEVNKDIKTFDFETLYTSIPNNLIKNFCSEEKEVYFSFREACIPCFEEK